MLTTDEGGTADETLAYTAFGEPVGPGGVGVPPASDTRYRYAGGWGYEDDLLKLDGAQGTKPIVLLHVGWRWYDPGLGRFIQRDPIGLQGGFNAYAYCGNDAARTADPRGTDVWVDIGPHSAPIIGPLPDGSYVRLDYKVNPTPRDIATCLVLGGAAKLRVTETDRPPWPPAGISDPWDDWTTLRWAHLNCYYYHPLFYNCQSFTGDVAERARPPLRRAGGCAPGEVWFGKAIY